MDKHEEPAHYSHKLPVKRDDDTKWRIYRPTFSSDDFKMLLDPTWNSLARDGNHLAIEVRQMTHAMPLSATPHALTVLPQDDSGDGGKGSGKIATCFYTCYPEGQKKRTGKSGRGKASGKGAEKKKSKEEGSDAVGQVMSILAGVPASDRPCVEILRKHTQSGDVSVALALEASIAVSTGIAAVVRCGIPSAMVATYMPSAARDDGKGGERVVPSPVHDARLHQSVLSYMGNGQVLLVGGEASMAALVEAAAVAKAERGEAASPAAAVAALDDEAKAGAAARAAPVAEPKVVGEKKPGPQPKPKPKCGVVAMPLCLLAESLAQIGGVDTSPGSHGMKYAAARMALDGEVLNGVAGHLQKAGVFEDGAAKAPAAAPALGQLKVKLKPRLLMCFQGAVLDEWSGCALGSGAAAAGEGSNTRMREKAAAAVEAARAAEGMMRGDAPLEHLREAAARALQGDESGAGADDGASAGARASFGSGSAAAGGAGGVEEVGKGAGKSEAGTDVHSVVLKASTKQVLLTYEASMDAKTGMWTIQLNLPGGKRRFAETDWGCAMRHLKEESGLGPEHLELAGLNPVARTMADPQCWAGSIRLELMRLFVYSD